MGRHTHHTDTSERKPLQKQSGATRKREISAHRATEEETQGVTPIVLSDFCSNFEDVASKIETQ